MDLIFLRHAYSRFLAVKDGIEANLPKRGGKTPPLSKRDFSQKSAIFLQPKAQFDHLVALTDSDVRAKAIIEAMESIESDYENLRGVPQANDLVLAREAPAGNIAIIKNGQEVCLGQRTVHLRPDQSQVDPDFLCYYLLTPYQQRMLLAGETGATSKHVNMKDIRRLPLDKLPPVEVKRSIGSILSAYDDLIENNRR